MQRSTLFSSLALIAGFLPLTVAAQQCVGHSVDPAARPLAVNLTFTNNCRRAVVFSGTVVITDKTGAAVSSMLEPVKLEPGKKISGGLEYPGNFVTPVNVALDLSEK